MCCSPARNLSLTALGLLQGGGCGPAGISSCLVPAPEMFLGLCSGSSFPVESDSLLKLNLERKENSFQNVLRDGKGEKALFCAASQLEFGLVWSTVNALLAEITADIGGRIVSADALE